MKYILSVALLVFGLSLAATAQIIKPTHSDLVYGTGAVLAPSKSIKDLTLDVYSPKKMQAGKRYPAVMIIHGGGFNRGDKRQGSLLRIAKTLVTKGYVVTSINYRMRDDKAVLAPPFDKVLKDAKTQKSKPIGDKTKAIAAFADSLKALNWMHDNAGTYQIDPDNITILGSSAGSDTVINLAYRTQDFGIKRPAIRAVVDLWGGLTFNDDRALVRAGDPPLFVVHGSKDKLRSFADSQRLVKAASAVGVKAKLVALMDRGHSFKKSGYFTVKTETSKTAFVDMIDFILSHKP